jgi:hypothetical protein
MPSLPHPDERPPPNRAPDALLAVDLGLRTGLAGFGRDGRLLHYESRNFGAPARLKRAIPLILRAAPELEHVILEGGGPIADLWRRELERRQIPFQIVAAETWREELLYPRRRRSGELAKRSACDLARRVIASSDAKRTKSLRNDAAEAILLGLWGVRRLGWLPRLPEIEK